MTMEEIQNFLIFDIDSNWHRHIPENRRILVVREYLLCMVARIQRTQNLRVLRNHHQNKLETETGAPNWKMDTLVP